MTLLGGGYDLDFVSEVPEEFICCVCHLTLKEPVQIEDCGHRLCKTCFSQMKEQAKRRYFHFGTQKYLLYNRLMARSTL